jgi:hypothetical protein
MLRASGKPHAVLVYVRLKDSKDGQIKIVAFECIVDDETYKKYLRRITRAIRQDIGVDVSEENAEDWLKEYDIAGVYDELREIFLGYLLLDAKQKVLASHRFIESYERLSGEARKRLTEVVRESNTLDEVIEKLHGYLELHFYGFVNLWSDIVDLWKKYVRAVKKSDILWDEFGFTREEMRKWKMARFSPADARAWADAGFDPEDARIWRAFRFNPEVAKKWVEHGFTAEEAVKWRSARIPPERANIMRGKVV